MRLVGVLLCLSGLLLFLAAACGGKTGSEGASTAAADGGPNPTATSEPTQTGLPVVRTSLQGDCRLTPMGAEIHVEYSVFTSGATVLTRVRLLENGREVEDSGELEQRTFRRVSVFQVEPGDSRTYRIAAEVRGGSAGNVQTTVRCGSVATATPGPRA